MDKEKKEPEISVFWLPAILALGIAYVKSLIDLVPDMIPLFGQLDDVVVAIAIVWLFTSWLPKNRHRIYWFKPRASSRAGQPAGAKRETTATREEEFDPFKVLNIARSASEAEIKRAYREMMVKYHPDKVIHLGEEFQRLAHGKVVEITRAYEMLSGKE